MKRKQVKSRYRTDRVHEYIRLCIIGEQGRIWECDVASCSPHWTNDPKRWLNEKRQTAWEKIKWTTGPHQLCRAPEDVEISPDKHRRKFGWLVIINVT